MAMVSTTYDNEANTIFPGVFIFFLSCLFFKSVAVRV